VIVERDERAARNGCQQTLQESKVKEMAIGREAGSKGREEKCEHGSASQVLALQISSISYHFPNKMQNAGPRFQPSSTAATQQSRGDELIKRAAINAPRFNVRAAV
jgi:hypothetical protein